jgi:hypothetical protein
MREAGMREAGMREAGMREAGMRGGVGPAPQGREARRLVGSCPSTPGTSSLPRFTRPPLRCLEL